MNRPQPKPNGYRWQPRKSLFLHRQIVGLGGSTGAGGGGSLAFCILKNDYKETVAAAGAGAGAGAVAIGVQCFKSI